MATPKGFRRYCCVYGCLNSSIRNPGISFFTLPAQPERLSEWLRLICRDDLANKPTITAYRICEIHFHVRDILPTSNRKILKKNSLPSLNLPDLESLQPAEPIQPETIKQEEPEIKQEEPEIKLQYPVIKKEYSLLQDKETQTQTNTVNERHTQTTAALSYNTPRERKLRDELIECKKRLKQLQKEAGLNTLKAQKNTFHNLCDKFLTKELALLVKAQTNLKLHGKGNRYDKDYIIFCLSLYFTSPQAFRLLQSALCFPCITTLYKHSFPITTDGNERAMNILKMKVEQMTVEEKHCSVMIDATSILANVANIKQNKIIGFREEGWQSPKSVKHALVIMVRGIFVDWKQPIAYAFLSDCRNHDETIQWVDKILGKLLEIGLNVRTLVSNLRADFWNAAKKRSISIEQPYFFVNDRKIYYIFDTPHLIKNVRNNLMQYDFHFGNSVAKYKYIEQFYNQDVKKSCRLAHKLTNSHIKPTNIEKMKVSYATQLFSESVATGMFTCIDNHEIEESARHTAKLITTMNDLFDSLNSSVIHNNHEHKRAYEGHESQTTFFRGMLSFLEDLKLINPNNGRDCTSNVTFIEGFKITITSLGLLFEDLRLEGFTYLLTRRLNLDALEHLFGQMRTKRGPTSKPTCRQFEAAFKRLYFSNIIKSKKEQDADDSVEASYSSDL